MIKAMPTQLPKLYYKCPPDRVAREDQRRTCSQVRTGELLLFLPHPELPPASTCPVTMDGPTSSTSFSFTSLPALKLFPLWPWIGLLSSPVVSLWVSSHTHPSFCPHHDADTQHLPPGLCWKHPNSILALLSPQLHSVHVRLGRFSLRAALAVITCSPAVHTSSCLQRHNSLSWLLMNLSCMPSTPITLSLLPLFLDLTPQQIRWLGISLPPRHRSCFFLNLLFPPLCPNSSLPTPPS